MSRFLNSILTKEGGLVRLVTANENGKPAWFIVELNPLQYKEYKLAFRQTKMNLIDYGKILASGWGELTESLIKNLKEEFSIAA